MLDEVNAEVCRFSTAQAAEVSRHLDSLAVGCVDDGTCNMGENAEDCSCADCNPGPNCVNANPDQGPGPDQGPAPASTTDTSTTDASTTGSGMGGQGGA